MKTLTFTVLSSLIILGGAAITPQPQCIDQGVPISCSLLYTPPVQTAPLLTIANGEGLIQDTQYDSQTQNTPYVYTVQPASILYSNNLQGNTQYVITHQLQGSSADNNRTQPATGAYSE